MGYNMASRVTRLVSASLNALIDEAENISPQIVMQEGIREIENLVDEVKISLGKESVKKLQAQQQVQNITKEYDTLASQIEIAIEKERDDLAKSAIAKQIELENQALSQKEELSGISENISKLEGYIDALAKKKAQMKQELEEFIKINQSQQNQSSVDSTINKIDNLFDRLGNSVNISVSNDDVALTQLDTLNKDHEVAKRLKAIKNKKS